MQQDRKILRIVLNILVTISFIVTFVVGIFFVLNYKNIGKMLEVATIIKFQYLEDVPLEQMIEGAVEGMVESLGDPYSVYMNSEEYQSFRHHIEGSIGGIGVYVGVKDGKYVVHSVIKATPAFKAGMLKGDTLFKVNDELTSEMDFEEVISKMRGNSGENVQISVIREGKIKEFEITREEIDIPTVESEVLPGGIGYLQLALFASNSDEALAEQLNVLKEKNIKALILDLRNNPGGDLDAAVNISKFFVPKGPVVYVVDKNGSSRTMENKITERLEIPLVVLINGGSASASEVLAGAIKDTNSGVLIGEKTFGKALVQVLLPLSGGDAIKLTTAKYLTPNKHDIQAKGIEPDIEAILKAEDQEDVQLKKALEVIEEQIHVSNN